MRYTADFKITVTVEFDDNGDDDLKDQASEALADMSPFSVLENADIDMIGSPSPKGKADDNHD